MDSTALGVINDPDISLDRKILILEDFKSTTLNHIEHHTFREKRANEYQEYLDFLDEEINKRKEERIQRGKRG